MLNQEMTQSPFAELLSKVAAQTESLHHDLNQLENRAGFVLRPDPPMPAPEAANTKAAYESGFHEYLETQLSSLRCISGRINRITDRITL